MYFSGAAIVLGISCSNPQQKNFEGVETPAVLGGGRYFAGTISKQRFRVDQRSRDRQLQGFDREAVRSILRQKRRLF